MKKALINNTHIEGLLYQHSLEEKVTGPQSKNPGTQYISGNVEIATDDALVNIVSVHFSYVTPTTAKGTANATYAILADIISGRHASIMGDGAEKAAKLRIDSAIGLNEFFTDRNGKEELVSAKRNEGGFVHVVSGAINPDEKARSTFETDIVITGVKHIDADPEKDLPEKAVVSGAIFDFRKSLLPVEFTVLNANAIKYFEGLDASTKTPVFTKVKGRQVSQTIVKKIVEESAFGDASVREVPSTRKDFVITWAQQTPYTFDDPEYLTAQELTEMVAARQTTIATLKQRNDEYKASKAAQASTPAPGGFNF